MGSWADGELLNYLENQHVLDLLDWPPDACADASEKTVPTFVGRSRIRQHSVSDDDKSVFDRGDIGSQGVSQLRVLSVPSARNGRRVAFVKFFFSRLSERVESYCRSMWVLEQPHCHAAGHCVCD
jgi:hypothetical protein